MNSKAPGEMTVKFKDEFFSLLPCHSFLPVFPLFFFICLFFVTELSPVLGEDHSELCWLTWALAHLIKSRVFILREPMDLFFFFWRCESGNLKRCLKEDQICRLEEKILSGCSRVSFRAEWGEHSSSPPCTFYCATYFMAMARRGYDRAESSYTEKNYPQEKGKELKEA